RTIKRPARAPEPDTRSHFRITHHSQPEIPNCPSMSQAYSTNAHRHDTDCSTNDGTNTNHHESHDSHPQTDQPDYPSHRAYGCSSRTNRYTTPTHYRTHCTNHTHSPEN